jgi:PAS domain S-box-containing protein
MSPLGPDEIAGLGFEQVVRRAPVAIVVVDSPGRVIYSNGRAQELTLRQLGTAMPEDLDGGIDIFHPDGRRYERGEWPAVRSLRTGEEIDDEECFYTLPDGGRLHMQCSSSPVRDEDGAIVAAVLALTDVTERKREEERRTYLAGLLDNTEDAVVAMDAGFLLTVWNAGAERLYGWRVEEAVGRHADEVARTSLTEEERTELRRELAATGRWRGEVTVRRKDGTTVEAELVSVALRGEQGDITGYLTIHRDISDRRRLEEVRDAERSRIARDLHDEALQGLTHALAVSGRDASGRAGEVYAILQRVDRQLRAAIEGLRLEDDGERSFADALGQLVALNREMAPGCNVVLEIDGDLPDGPFGPRGTEVLRIVGEAIANACRHAAPDRVVVRVAGSEARLSVEVADDGRGFDPTPALYGQGLRGMHERAELLGAQLDVRSDETGTTVALQVALS